MQPKNLLTAKNRNELRVWLAENYDKERRMLGNCKARQTAKR